MTKNEQAVVMAAARGDLQLPDYGHPHRLPFQVGGMCFDERGMVWDVVRIDMSTAYGISKALATCVQSLGICTGCGRPPFPLEMHAKCPKKYLEAAHAICQVVFSNGVSPAAESELKRDYARANQFLRKHRLSNAPRRERVHQKYELFEFQERHCYYCFRALELSGDFTDFDHFVPISQGGTDDIWNLVVTCKECNHEKGTIHGIVFRAAMLDRLDEATRKSVAALQSRVDAWRELKLEEHRTAKADLAAEGRR